MIENMKQKIASHPSLFPIRWKLILPSTWYCCCTTIKASFTNRLKGTIVVDFSACASLCVSCCRIKKKQQQLQLHNFKPKATKSNDNSKKSLVEFPLEKSQASCSTQNQFWFSRLQKREDGSRCKNNHIQTTPLAALF